MKHSLQPTPGLIETMTISEVAAFHPEVAIIPLGSTEPHGPHLPYGTDTLIADGVTAEAVQKANAQGARILRLPPLPFGNNVNFKEFPFACRLGVETLVTVVMDLIGFLHEEGIRKVVIFNGHGGNDATIKGVLRQAFDRYQQEVFVCACAQWNFCEEKYHVLFNDKSPHAGQYETSMIQYLAPDLVLTEELKPAEMHKPAVNLSNVEWVKPWHQLMPSSCAGRPDLASAEKGGDILSTSTTKLAEFLTELSRTPWHPQFPYAQTQD